MQSQLPWWVNGLAIPAFFTVLGASLGFFFGQIKDWLQAHRSKKAFLEAVGTELGLITTDLENASKFAEILLLKLQASGHAPQILPNWGTTVFDTQLGKLGNVADELVVETIRAYASVGRIGQLVGYVNDNSQDYVSASAGNEKAAAQDRLKSTIIVLIEQIASALPTLQALIRKLPRHS